MGAQSGNHTLEGLIDELARVLHDPDAARELVLRVGFPPADLPAFDTPRVFWSRVLRAAADGKTRDGVGAIVERAKAAFPGNRLFATYGSSTAVASEPTTKRLGSAIDSRGARIGQQIIVHSGLDAPLDQTPTLDRQPATEAKTDSPVLVLALANDRVVAGRTLRNLPAERRAIQQQLAAHAEVRVLPDAILEEVWDALGDASSEGRLQIFHFAGHANGSWLALENEAGVPAKAHAEGLAGFLGRLEGLVLVFLNGCSTLPQVARLRQGVRAVIATTDAILDNAAAELAGRFYSGLRSKPLERAFLDAVDFMKAKYGNDARGVLRRELVHDDNEAVSWPWILDCDEACNEWRLGQEPPPRPRHA